MDQEGAFGQQAPGDGRQAAQHGPAGEEGAGSENAPGGYTPSDQLLASTDPPVHYAQPPEPVYRIDPRFLLDIPAQLVPEETKAHLRNARREAVLALYTLWQSISEARRGPKVRRHIDVE